MMSAKTDAEEAIAVEVLRERDRQDAKWGEQNHPDGTGVHVLAFDDFGHATLVEMTGPWIAEVAKVNTDEAAKAGTVTWGHILFEEVTEAFAEDDPEKLRTELIQVAAVAQQWVGAIDRRSA
jgi:alpha-D-ribose 1-methylphosphonate 5-triphosphate synthase subunit PhnH